MWSLQHDGSDQEIRGKLSTSLPVNICGARQLHILPFIDSIHRFYFSQYWFIYSFISRSNSVWSPRVIPKAQTRLSHEKCVAMNDILCKQEMILNQIFSLQQWTCPLVKDRWSLFFCVEYFVQVPRLNPPTDIFRQLKILTLLENALNFLIAQYGHIGLYGHIGAAIKWPKEYLCGVPTETYTQMSRQKDTKD